MSKIGRDLSDVIIIDNTPRCYKLQKKNALPIVSWFDDPSDRELLKLLPLLTKLYKVRDVRDYIKKLVKGNKINFGKVHRIFREPNLIVGRTSDRRTTSNRAESQARPKTADWGLNKMRDYSQAREYQPIKSQYKPVIKAQKEESSESMKDPNTASTRATEKDTCAKSQTKTTKGKRKVKQGFINIDNVAKRIYPKGKKISKKSNKDK